MNYETQTVEKSKIIQEMIVNNVPQIIFNQIYFQFKNPFTALNFKKLGPSVFVEALKSTDGYHA